MFLHLSVSHSVHREGMSASVHAGIHPSGADSPPGQTSLGQTPLQEQTPHGQTYPRRRRPGAAPPPNRYPSGADSPTGQISPWQTPLQDQTPLPPWADTPPGADPLEKTQPKQTPLLSRHPPSCIVYASRYGQKAGGTHPTGMHTRFIFYTSFWLKTYNLS